MGNDFPERRFERALDLVDFNHPTTGRRYSCLPVSSTAYLVNNPERAILLVYMNDTTGVAYYVAMDEVAARAHIESVQRSIDGLPPPKKDGL